MKEVPLELPLEPKESEESVEFGADVAIWCREVDWAKYSRSADDCLFYWAKHSIGLTRKVLFFDEECFAPTGMRHAID